MNNEFDKSSSFKFVNLGIVLNKKGEVLIVKRKKIEETLGGEILLWVFPGGIQEKGESREERVVKEVLDETGYKVKPLKQINLRLHPDTGVMVAYFLCELEKDDPVQDIIEKDEIEELKWVKPEDLKNYFRTNLDPEVKKILKL